TSLSGSFADPGTLDTHVVVINWGDGSANTTLNLTAGVTSFSGVSHQYLDNQAADAPYTISATVTDKDGAAASGSTQVTVHNVAPTAAIAGPSSGSIGQSLTYTVSATDPGSVDTATGFAYNVNWGDGTSTSIAASANNGSGV